MATCFRLNAEASNDALWNFSKAFPLDPEFAAAYGMAAWCHMWRKIYGFMVDPARESTNAVRLARCAIELGQDDPVALACGGLCAWLRRRRTGDRCRFRRSRPSAQPSFCTQLALQRLAQCFSAIRELPSRTSRK
jgi:hypothetical protein